MSKAPEPGTFVERGLALFEELVRADEVLRAELSSSASEFFGGGPPPDRDAARRHLEWFLFERPSAKFGIVPAEELLSAFRERAGGGLARSAELFLDSRVGVFEVTAVRRDSGVWLLDLLGAGEYPLAEPEAAAELSEGDLIVGRLYPMGDGSFRASSAAGCFRNAGLREALRGDLARARSARRGVPRLSQAMLESTFFRGRASEVASLADEAMARAAAWLMESGVDAERCEAIFAELRAEPYAPDALVGGAGDALGRILDSLAFDTDVDLGRARLLLAEAWSILGAPADVEGQEGPADPRRALDEFDRARAAGGDLEQLFDRLERDLGLEPSADDEDSPAPDFPGVVGAMVQEFLWEETRGEPGRAEELAGLDQLARFAEPLGLFEELGAHHLLAFASCWVIEHGQLAGGRAALDLLAALRDFCRWADSQHGLDLWAQFEPTLRALERTLPRVVEANRLIERGGAAGRAKPVEVLEVDRAEARVRDGEETLLVPVERGLAAALRCGDWLRVVDGAQPRIVGVYPPESSAVLLAAS